MNQTTIVVQIILALISSGVVSGVVTYFIRRDSNQLKVRLAEIESDKAETAREAATTSGALTLAATVVTTFEPVKVTLENMAKVTGDLVAVVTDLIKRADDMHQVVERRDRESAEDRKVRDANQQAVLTRLDANQTKLDDIARHITLATDENTLRHEVAKILLVAKEISLAVQQLSKPPKPEPSEAQGPDQVPVDTTIQGEDDHVGNPS